MFSANRPSGQVIAHFDQESASYAARRAQEFGFQTQLRLVDQMLAGCSGRVLDLGCGSGAAVPLFRRRGFDVVGVDFSPEMLTYARRQFAADARVTFCRANAESLPFRSDSLDHLVCLGLMEYLDTHEQAVREIARVLRAGGTAVFSIPSGISPNHFTRTLAFGLWRLGKTLLRKAGTARPKRNLGVPWRFRRLLRQAGFEPLPNKYCAFFIFPLDILAPRLHERVARSLEFLSAVPLLAWTGTQYMVSARKAQTARTRLPARGTTAQEHLRPHSADGA
jgi:ubiquinone/menaquinone biosynthesis C-methylase UbiE